MQNCLESRTVDDFWKERNMRKMSRVYPEGHRFESYPRNQKTSESLEPQGLWQFIFLFSSPILSKYQSKIQKRQTIRKEF